MVKKRLLGGAPRLLVTISAGAYGRTAHIKSFEPTFTSVADDIPIHQVVNAGGTIGFECARERMMQDAMKVKQHGRRDRFLFVIHHVESKLVAKFFRDGIEQTISMNRRTKIAPAFPNDGPEVIDQAAIAKRRLKI